MEMLPGAVQVLIEWIILAFSTVIDFFKKMNSDD